MHANTGTPVHGGTYCFFSPGWPARYIRHRAFRHFGVCGSLVCPEKSTFLIFLFILSSMNLSLGISVPHSSQLPGVTWRWGIHRFFHSPSNTPAKSRKIKKYSPMAPIMVPKGFPQQLTHDSGEPRGLNFQASQQKSDLTKTIVFTIWNSHMPPPLNSSLCICSSPNRLEFKRIQKVHALGTRT